MIRAILLTIIVATSSSAETESPLDYLLSCLRAEALSGVVLESSSHMVWPEIVDSIPTATMDQAKGSAHSSPTRQSSDEAWESFVGQAKGVADATIKIKWSNEDALKHFLTKNGFKRDSFLESIPVFRKAFGDSKINAYTRSLDLPQLGRVLIHSYSSTGSNDISLSLVIYQFTTRIVRPDATNAEQAGTGQPATRPESKSEGGAKPQPEAEGRSR